MTIPDFINKHDKIPLKMQTTLMNIYNYYGYNIEEVVEYEYIRQRNTGPKSWEQFKKIRDEFFNHQNK